ncbi:MAG TPA: ribonucleoside reductase class II [Methanoregulaceae archaeon]|nr:ribonucleoside reductase class II [Methanoregulaceae archaeon]
MTTSPVVDSILSARYLRRGEKGFEDICRRVAAALAEDADDRAAFYEAMSSLRFLPNSPTLMNAGTEIGQLSACFTLPVSDSIEGIFESMKYGAIIHKTGGGTGYNFSHIRPEGSPVQSTDGVASGPVSFIRVFNAATDVIKQGGRRRGANMGILNVWHPDILAFIAMKREEGDVANFNLSVMVDDRFMGLVERKEFDAVWLVHPVTGASVTVGEIWAGIVDGIWKNGEPGILFHDEINRHNPTPQLGPIDTTNPCVTADTWVMTGAGPRQVAELVGTAFDVAVNGMTFRSGPDGFFSTGTKKVVRLTTKEGHCVRLTRDHPVCRVKSVTRNLTEIEWTRVGDLSAGDRVFLHDHRALLAWKGSLTQEEGYLLGLLVGDGTLKSDVGVLSVWESDCGAMSVMEHEGTCASMLAHRSDFSGGVAVRGRGEHRLKLAAIRDLAASYGMAPGKKTVTTTLERASSAGYRGFLSGLFDCDGSVQGSTVKGVSVRLAQSSRPLLCAVQRMLLRLGIASQIYSRRDVGLKMLPDGRGGSRPYPTRAQYEMVIASENLARFRDRVGFIHARKREALERALSSYSRSLNRENFVATVAALQDDGEEAVFDLQVPGINAFDANGFVAHNCGEQPLLPFESCVLGSINLAAFVSDGAIDLDGVEATARMATRFLDLVIDRNVYPIPQIEEATRRTRKIGLGVMGVHDAMLMLDLSYDSDEGRAWCEKVMERISAAAVEESRRRAESLGPFPAFEGSTWELPVRNAAMTTVAPTGTISLLAGCSSGIEPVFSYAYTRKNTVGKTFVIVNPVFRDALDRTIAETNLPEAERATRAEEVVSHVHETGTVQDLAWLPQDFRRLFRTALDISWQDHIRMQASFQRHVHASISKTVNMPSSATKEDCAEALLMAWRLGLKGITIYRTGSRESVVLALKETEALPPAPAGKILPEQVPRLPLDRPKELAGRTYLCQSGCCRLYVTVNLLEGKPIEVFIRTVGQGGCEASSNAMGRAISTGLQNGVPYQKFVRQFAKVNCISAIKNPASEGHSCADVVGRCIDLSARNESITTLQDWEIRQVDSKTTRRLCPDCREPLDFGRGCNQGICKHCGWSGCS